VHATEGLLAVVGVPARGHASADREAQIESSQHPANSSLAQHAAGQPLFGWCSLVSLVQVTPLPAVTSSNHCTAHMQARRDAKEQARRDRLAAEEAERVLVSHFAF